MSKRGKTPSFAHHLLHESQIAIKTLIKQVVVKLRAALPVIFSAWEIKCLAGVVVLLYMPFRLVYNAMHLPML